jgi:hypothetical protein
LIVEGEKDADNLFAAGFAATTNSGGAGKWTADLNRYFEGRDIHILPDNDEAGAGHAQQVAAALLGVARSIRIIRLPGLPPKGDVTDWLDAGGTVDGLADLLRAAPEAEAAAPSPVVAKPYQWTKPESVPGTAMALRGAIAAQVRHGNGRARRRRQDQPGDRRNLGDGFGQGPPGLQASRSASRLVLEP